VAAAQDTKQSRICGDLEGTQIEPTVNDARTAGLIGRG
jgi:hypothetical protein